jgi:hypothetical protein
MSWLIAMWIAVLLVAAVLIVALKRLDRRYGRPGGRSHLDQWHHGYLVLVATGVLATLTAQHAARIAGSKWPLRALVFLVVSCITCAIDDGRQHWIQYLRYEYRSALWRLYRWWRTR